MAHIQKISIIELRTFISTLPLTRAQQLEVSRLLTGYDIDPRGKIILLPEIINIPQHLPPKYHGAYTVADIVEMSTGEDPGDIMRVIIMEGDPNFGSEPGPPLRVLIQLREEGIDHLAHAFIIYSHDIHCDLLEGINAAVEQSNRNIETHHAIVQNIVSEQLALLRAL